MMRKALMTILSILMLLIVSCSEYNIYREEISICRVGDTYFDTLQAAVDYIGSSRAIRADPWMIGVSSPGNSYSFKSSRISISTNSSNSSSSTISHLFINTTM